MQHATLGAEQHTFAANRAFRYLVPRGGLEPPRPCGLRILSPLRLPISPSGHVCLTSSKTNVNSVRLPKYAIAQNDSRQFWCQFY
jgi:hypothetical protein